MRPFTWLGRLFPRNTRVDTVETRAHFDVPPEAVWQRMLFYEEVPGRPTALLRAFLPAPIRTEGEKTRVGAIVKCQYDGGYLEKRITGVEPAKFVRFEVLVQRLGVEDCISMNDGAYDYRADGDGCELVLTTRYRGHLRPRWLFRPFEAFLAHRMHDYILNGMKVSVRAPALAPVAADHPAE
jgi:hypothetical protein